MPVNFGTDSTLHSFFCCFCLFILLDCFRWVRIDTITPSDKIIFWNQYFQRYENCMQNVIEDSEWISISKSRPNRSKSNKTETKRKQNRPLSHKNKKLDRKKQNEQHIGFSFLKPLRMRQYRIHYLSMPLPLPLLALLKRKCRHCLHSLALLTRLLLSVCCRCCCRRHSVTTTINCHHHFHHTYTSSLVRSALCAFHRDISNDNET